jgi:hypothetical protein
MVFEGATYPNLIGSLEKPTISVSEPVRFRFLPVIVVATSDSEPLKI